MNAPAGAARWLCAVLVGLAAALFALPLVGLAASAPWPELAAQLAAGPVHEWFYIHPAGGFGPWNDGERTGSYRDGGDVLVTDADGESNISGADFGIAVVDEIEDPKHRGERFTVGY